MASGSDVRAGRAYVELGTKDSKLIAGLRAALARVRSWSESAVGIGTRMAIFGKGLAIALGVIANKFAGAGVELSKIQKQTGLSADALAGLSQKASENEVEISTLARSLTFLQKTLAGGSEETEKALKALGLSLDEARAMPFADLLATIADRLPRVGDEITRADLAMKLFGKSGTALLPVLADGAAGLNEAGKRARELGTAMDQDMLDAAGRLDDAFDALGGALNGFRNAAGQALAEALVPLVEGIARVLAAVGQWIKQNPESVQTILHVSAAVGILGTAVAGLAVTVLALTSPLVLTIALLAGIAAGALAVTDALGITATGFGDLFNSIRVGGQGLATWMAKLWSYVIEGWSVVVFSIESLFDGLWTVAKGIAGAIRDAFVAITKPIADTFGGLFDWLRDAFNAVFGWIVDALKKVVGWIRDAFSWLWDNTVGLLLAADEGNPQTGAPGFAERQDERRAQLDRAIAAQQVRREELDELDPNDGTRGVRFDPQRATDALSKIGRNLTDAITEAVDGVAARQSEIAAAAPSFKAVTPATETVEAARTADAAQTFNASLAGRLGVTSSTAERTARNTERTARSTEQMLQEIRELNANGGTFGT